ncbi:MAG: DUF2071 domain-containing protein [Mycobacteriales bacterium]
MNKSRRDFWQLPEPIAPIASALDRPQIMAQRWADVAFLHWRVEPARVAPLLPAGTRPDVHDGSSWVGLIPFRMVGAGLGTGPAVPWLGTFAETNVRLYAVDREGRRGVVFRSLEASRLAVVLGARLSFGLPYFWARMRVLYGDGTIEYTTERRWPGPRGAACAVRLRPQPATGLDAALAHFLTARWGLHTHWLGRSLYVPNEHETWPLQPAAVELLRDDLVAAAGLPGISGREPDSVLFSPGVHTRFGLPFDSRRPLASDDQV